MGSFSSILPSSTNINAATEVIGFVMEAMRKIVSREIGLFASKSRQPTQVLMASASPSRHTNVAAPASSPASTTGCKAALIFS